MTKGDYNRKDKMMSQFALLKPGVPFAIWDMKFRAYPQGENFADALMNSFKAKMPTDEAGILDKMIQIENIQRRRMPR